MANRKVSYKNLLKQAISEYDTSKTVQVKGPMLDPILSWDGDGEIPIYKDAASILERYYFNENAEDPVMVPDFDEDLAEMEYNEDGTESKTASEKHGEGPGTHTVPVRARTGLPALRSGPGGRPGQAQESWQVSGRNHNGASRG